MPVLILQRNKPPLYRAYDPIGGGWVGGCQPWDSAYSGSR